MLLLKCALCRYSLEVVAAEDYYIYMPLLIKIVPALPRANVAFSAVMVFLGQMERWPLVANGVH